MPGIVKEKVFHFHVSLFLSNSGIKIYVNIFRYGLFPAVNANSLFSASSALFFSLCVFRLFSLNVHFLHIFKTDIPFHNLQSRPSSLLHPYIIMAHFYKTRIIITPSRTFRKLFSIVAIIMTLY